MATKRLMGIDQIVSNSGKVYDVGTLPSSGKIRRLKGVDQVVNSDTGFSIDVDAVGYRVYHLSGHGPAPYFFDLQIISMLAKNNYSPYARSPSTQNTVQKGSYATGAQAAAWCSGDGGGTGYGSGFGSNGSIALHVGGDGESNYAVDIKTNYYKTNLVVSENTTTYGSSVYPFSAGGSFCDGDNLYSIDTRDNSGSGTANVQKKSFFSSAGSVSMGTHSYGAGRFGRSGNATFCNNETAGFYTEGRSVKRFSFNGSSDARVIGDLSDITQSNLVSTVTQYGCTTNGPHVMTITLEQESIYLPSPTSGAFTKIGADSLSFTNPYGQMASNLSNGGGWQSLTTDGDDIIVTGGHYTTQSSDTKTNYYHGRNIVHKKSWNSSSNSTGHGSLTHTRYMSKPVTGG